MDIIIRNTSGEPIYEQIAAQIKSFIMDGTLAAGDALPSMRALALQLRISVITTKRAYEELERDGFIESYTGKGSFVRGQNTELLREEHYRRVETLLKETCDAAKCSGIPLQELREILTIIYGEDDENNGKL